MKAYVVKANRTQQTRQLFAFIGESQAVQYDFKPWEADNGEVTAVTWTTETGQAGITNKDLTSSIASATITTSQEGKSLIKLTATAGNNTFVTYLEVKAKDPKSNTDTLTRSHYY
jgi:hypothetical protein